MGRTGFSDRVEERGRSARRQRLDRSRQLIRPGASAKSQIWRTASWLCGWGLLALGADFFIGSRRLLEWGLALVVVPFLLTVPYGLARLRGEDGYRASSGLVALRPVALHVYVLLTLLARFPMGIGDHAYTLVWRSIGHALHSDATPPDALEPVGRRAAPPAERRRPVVVYDEDEPTDDLGTAARAAPPAPRADLVRRYPILFGGRTPIDRGVRPAPSATPGRASGRAAEHFGVLQDRSDRAGNPFTRLGWRLLGR